MIFAAFNGAAFIHMFLMAYETKGKTLEEMDTIFDSGRWPWQKPPKESRLDQLAADIEKGNIKVIAPHLPGGNRAVAEEVAPVTEEKTETTTETPKI